MKLLGKTVKCRITDFEGTATAHVTYINGCVQYCVTPKSTDGKMPASEYIDVQQLQEIGSSIPIGLKQTGGPQRDCPKR